MSECLFCKIIEKKIPCYKIYEDDLILAFLDISQCTIGHTLVIPKKHYNNMLECEESYLSQVFLVAQKLARMIEQKLNCKGFNILTNINETAGQSVMHFHLHIIPRYNESDQFDIHQNSNPVDKAYLNEIYNKLK